MDIVRKAITTSYNRRNVDYNPEFLDKQVLLKKYYPLMRSIHKYFCSYVGILDQPYDVDDLMSQIQMEFLNLAQKFDPKRGVDFPGYIKLNLRHKIYHYVTKSQKLQSREQLIRQYGEDYSLPDKSDEKVADQFDVVEILASIPWHKLKQMHRIIVVDLIKNHKTLEQIARDHGYPIKEVRANFELVIDLLQSLQDDFLRKKEIQTDYDDDWDEEEWFGTEIEDWGYNITDKSLKQKDGEYK